MANQKYQKLKLLTLLKLLQEYTDRNHELRCDDLIQLLDQQGISAERKSIYTDLNILKEAGIELEYRPGRGYALIRRDFELAELKVLSDAVRASAFLTLSQTHRILDKLGAQCSCHERPLILEPEKTRPPRIENRSFLNNVDLILDSIRKNVEIEFRYFDITVRKEKQYRRQSRTYQLFPYALIWENQRYYCIAYSFHHQGFSHYRVDKMDQIRLKETPHTRLPFDLDAYSAKVFNMYSTAQENMTLRFNLSLANTVFDQFGTEVMVTRVTENDFDINVTTSTAPTFLGWLFQFGRQVQIIQPESLKAEMKKAALEVLQQLD